MLLPVGPDGEPSIALPPLQAHLLSPAKGVVWSWPAAAAATVEPTLPSFCWPPTLRADRPSDLLVLSATIADAPIHHVFTHALPR